MTAPPGPKGDGLRPFALALGAAVLYLSTAPAVVNADGLGYLKLLPHNFAAGHLLFMPLLREATQLLGGDGLKIGRLLDALLGGTGVLFTYGIARIAAPIKSDRRFVATVAASGLAVSYGYWLACADVEAYALATVALLALVRVALPYRLRPGLPRALAMGLLLGLCVLCHLSHVLLVGFVIAICLEDPRGRRQGLVSAALALGVGGALSLSAYLHAAFIVRGHHAEGALRWVLSASHGFTESPGPYALAASIYGLCRSLVWSPYLHEADAPRLIGQLLLGIALLFGFLRIVLGHRSALIGLPLGPFAWLVLPYVLLALLFFGADTERWIFVLPILWIVVGVALDALSARRIWAPLTIGYLAVLNLSLAIWPQHRDGSSRLLAERAAQALSEGDLLVFPGHSWDEYVSFYARQPIEPFPLSYYAAKDGQARMWARLDREVASARARGHHVFAVRLFDEHREVADDPAGYAELRAIGLSRASLRAQLEQRFVVVHLTDEASRPGTALVRLDPVPPP